MNIEKVGNRGILFTFEELNKEPYNCITNVYVIVGSQNYFICDTYLGSQYMKLIKAYLEENYGVKSYIVFNSHNHWDHIWGNSEFRGCKIVAHEKCRAMIEETGYEDLKALEKEFSKEKIELLLPNTIFTDALTFDEEGIEFFYSPGHSEDSASCFDKVDKTLFVADNLDVPIPSFFSWDNIEGYIETLEKYLSLDINIVVQSHGKVMAVSDIKNNIDYLRNLLSGKVMKFHDPEVLRKHLSNMDFIKK